MFCFRSFSDVVRKDWNMNVLYLADTSCDAVYSFKIISTDITVCFRCIRCTLAFIFANTLSHNSLTSDVLKYTDIFVTVNNHAVFSCRKINKRNTKLS